MKYCDPCALRYGFPLTIHFHDDVKCQLCGEVCNCNDSPTTDLLSCLEPLQKEVKRGEEARKMLDHFSSVVYDPDKKV